MKLFVLTYLAAMTVSTSAFAPIAATPLPRACTLSMTVELTPEPEGGEELQAIKTIPETRMKNMGEADDRTTSDEGTVYTFWLSTIAEGELIKQIRTQVLKDASKKANFPGFRKGQIPPYAQPQMTGFAVQEALIRTVESAVKAFGLKSLPGSAGEVTILEEVKDMCKGYKVGDSLKFTAKLNAIFDPEKAPSKVTSEEAVETLEEEVK